jgi:hypothetical protein
MIPAHGFSDSGHICRSTSEGSESNSAAAGNGEWIVSLVLSLLTGILEPVTRVVSLASLSESGR